MKRIFAFVKSKKVFVTTFLIGYLSPWVFAGTFGLLLLGESKYMEKNVVASATIIFYAFVYVLAHLLFYLKAWLEYKKSRDCEAVDNTELVVYSFLFSPFLAWFANGFALVISCGIFKLLQCPLAECICVPYYITLRTGLLHVMIITSFYALLGIMLQLFLGHRFR